MTEPTGSPAPPAGPAPWLLAAAAALATVFALSWTAAEGGHGLSWSDLRTVVIVTAAVAVLATFGRRERRS